MDSAQKRNAWLLFMMFCIALVLFGLQYAGLRFFLYFHIWWYDIPMHLLGGMLIGLLSIRIYSAFHAQQTLSARRLLGIVLLSSLAVGVFWEVLEYKEGIAYTYVMSYPFDTAKDLVDDAAGACLGLVLYLRHFIVHE